MSNTRPLPPPSPTELAPDSHPPTDTIHRNDRAADPSSSLPPVPAAGCAGVAPGPAREGGGGPPRAPASVVEDPVLMPAQFFMILDGLCPELDRFILERVRFHFAVFPYIDMPCQRFH